jgi:predicted transposase YbfD/YdcC
LEGRQTASTTEKSRGRLETRTLTTTTNVIDSGYLNWPGAQQLIRLERQTIEKGGEIHSSVTYGITSASRRKADAGFLLQSSRSRWSIENRCFYVLDVTLGEDACRVRTGSAAQNLSRLRHALLNLARHLGQSVGSLCREHALKPHLLLQRLRILKN